MADDPLANAVETFSAPIEQLVIALGQGLAQAQFALDQNSIKTQESIDSDPVMSQYGLQATWYQMPNVTMQLKMALAITQDANPAPGPGPVIRPGIRIIAQPLSAGFQTHFSYDAQAATQINLTIAPVPPPRVAGPASARLDPIKVQAAALASPAKFLTTKDSGGNVIPALVDGQNNALRFDINFNGAAGLWYVLQYAPSNPAVPATVVAVDDLTASVRIITPS